MAPTTRILKDALFACRTGVLVAALFSMFVNVLMLTAPLYMMQMFDRVLASRSSETLVLLTLIAIIALLALAALEAVRAMLLIRMSTWLEQRLGGPVLSGSILGALQTGNGASIQGLRDLSTFRTFIAGPGIFPIMDAPWTPIFLTVIFLLHPALGWLSLCGALLLFAMAIANEMTTRAPLRQSSVASIRALRHAEAAVRNADVVEAMGMMPALIRRWHSLNAETLDLQGRASSRSNAITALSKFIRLTLQICILGAGAWLVIRTELTAGAMIAASILMGRALAPVEQAISAWKSAAAARNAYRRVEQQLAATPPRGEAMALPAPSGQLTVEAVRFVHPGTAAPVIQGVSFTLQPGEVLAVIGPTAAGKTTLARLLVGSLTPQAGHVRLDGMDVSRWESEDLGRHTGYLPQDVELFSGTVRENIARMDDGDTEAVIEAARLAQVHDMVMRLPNGYDTQIGEGGAALSGGQRQRVALARAVYGDPRFVVLDEPNANLDSDGEEALVKAIGLLKERGVTVVVIAHRPSILRHVDTILVLRAGRVQMFGPRDEIIPKVTGPEAGVRRTGEG